MKESMTSHEFYKSLTQEDWMLIIERANVAQLHTIALAEDKVRSEKVDTQDKNVSEQGYKCELAVLAKKEPNPTGYHIAQLI